MAAVAEGEPGQGDHIGATGAFQKVGDPALAEADVQELVAVDMGEPGDRRLRQMGQHHRHAGILRRAAGVGLVAQMGDMAACVEAVEQGVGAVGAIIGADDDMIKADGAVEGGPFHQERTFVAHAGGDGGEGHGRGGVRRKQVSPAQSARLVGLTRGHLDFFSFQRRTSV